MIKFFKKGLDGGPKSTVIGFWVVEIKWLFSIVLLIFNPGTREVFHSHAFNALTWWIKGEVIEYFKEGGYKIWKPSLIPKYTSKSCIHKVFAKKRTIAISFRGPWQNTWKEFTPTKVTILTHGRKVINELQR